MAVEVRPISTYPVAETSPRVDSRFSRQTLGGRSKVLLSDALTLLDREARFLECGHLIIEADFRETEIKNDGWPKATAKPATPRVVVSMMKTKVGDIRYPCDTFTRFEYNVRAVGLALEALRKVERYGVTRRGEQYAGWKALPASTTAPPSFDEAVATIAGYGQSTKQDIRRDSFVAQRAIREALAGSHPDRAGGSADAFHKVQMARAVIAKHHGLV